ncbi:hypothetical protein B0H13DRAFT_2386100 [Mycena leptocephala]|nr:hypothetical protein B0H13DRAFT_2386100 [Mycena leptocephala]
MPALSLVNISSLCVVAYVIAAPLFLPSLPTRCATHRPILPHILPPTSFLRHPSLPLPPSAAVVRLIGLRISLIVPMLFFIAPPAARVLRFRI